jgi:peptidoglycan/LPS O-acetylase OafA/YrhL
MKYHADLVLAPRYHYSFASGSGTGFAGSRGRMESVDGAGRSGALDALRTVAVVLVIMSHWGDDFPGNTLARLAARAGWAGVDLFFVLSGFLVSGLIFREYRKVGTFSARRFLVRRGLKIYPAFYVFLIGCLVYFTRLHTIGGPKLTVSRVLRELMFFQNYGIGIWGHTWSLAVEEHFYIGLTVFMVLAIKFDWLTGNVKRATLITAAIGFVCLAIRVNYAVRGTYDWRLVYAPTHTRIDSLAFGVFLSYCHVYHRERLSAFVRRRSRQLTFGSAVLVSTCVLFQRDTAPMYTIGLTLLACGFGGVVLLAVHADGHHGPFRFAVRWLSPVGRYSYSIYLWHAPAIIVVQILMKRWAITAGPYGELVADLCLALLLGWLFATMIEIPTLRARDRLYPSMVATRDNNVSTTTAALGIAPL